MRPDVLLVGDASSIHVRRLAAGLAGEGLQVEIACFEGEPIEGVPLHRLGGLPRRIDARYLLAAPRLAAVVRRRRPRVINAHYVVSFGAMSALAVHLAHPVGSRPPVVQTAWGDDLLVAPERSWMFRWLAQYTLRAAQLMTGDAQELRTAASKLAPATPTATFIFGPSVSLTIRRDDKEEIMVSARHLIPEMRVDLVVRAFMQARATSVELAGWQLLVAGDGPERGHITSLVAADVPVKVIGAQTHAATQDLLARAPLSISGPVSDGTSATLLESLAAAAVPVVNDLPANREWVDEDTGIVVSRDPTDDELSQAMIRAAGVAWNRARVRARVSGATWEAQVSGFADILRGLASEVANR